MNDTEFMDKIRSDLPGFISGRRLSHTYSVMEEASRLGRLYGLCDKDIRRLEAAGLLHDITKEKSFEEQLSLCRHFGYLYTSDDICSPKVLHSITGAYLAREKYGDTVDDIIFNAIKYHTTGRPDMSIYEKILYLADYIEPARTFGDCVKLRELFYLADDFTEEHLDRILLISYDMTLSSLISEGQYIHPVTVSARNYLINKLKIIPERNLSIQ